MALPARVTADHPKKFGSYELLEQLGQGGMAVVYRARIPGTLGRDLVLKAMLPNLCASKPLVEMFESEAKLTAQLRHPNIVEVTDYGIADGVPYLIMEYLDGRNLSQVRNALAKLQRRAPIGVAVAIARDLCRALGYAHHFLDASGKRIQVIHRDVSPSNVMVQRDGSVKLLDFGVAKLSSVGGQEITASLKGKFAYMAPEQVNHEPIDRRCDVFAAGIVLHELFAGSRLFGTKSERETLRRVANAEATIPSLSNPDVPPELDAIVMRALSLRPRDRFESGQEMAAALDATGLSAHPAELAKVIQLIAPRVVTAVTAVRATVRPSQASDDAATEIADDLPDSTAPGGESAPHLVVMPGDDAILDDSPLERSEVTAGDVPSKKVEIDKRELWGDPTSPARPAALVVVPDDTRPNELGEPTDPNAHAPDGPATHVYEPPGAPKVDRDFSDGATDIYAAPRLVAPAAQVPGVRPSTLKLRADPSVSVIFDEAATDPAAKVKGRGTELPAPFVADKPDLRPRRPLWPVAMAGLFVAIAVVVLFVRRGARVVPAQSIAAAAVPAGPAPKSVEPKNEELAQKDEPKRDARFKKDAPFKKDEPATKDEPAKKEESVSLVGLAKGDDPPTKEQSASSPSSAGASGSKVGKTTRPTAVRAPPRPVVHTTPVAPKHVETPKQSVKEGRIVDPFEGAE